jgi:glycosyltransferase involved in cell wall biosynthesis
MVITIALSHEKELPKTVRDHGRCAFLANWANVEEIPVCNQWNSWSVRHGLHETRNIIYAGTLGLKHDLKMFVQLAESFRSEPDVRVVIVSSGQAAEHLRSVALEHYLWNLVVLPFQPSGDVPQMLGSASVFIAPLDPSAGSFCVPSKVLSYLCAGRPIVIAIDGENAAAEMVHAAGAGRVVPPGDARAFIFAIRELLLDEPRRLREGAAARAFALQTFALDRVVPRFLEILSRANINLTQQVPPETEPLLAGSASSQD